MAVMLSTSFSTVEDSYWMDLLVFICEQSLTEKIVDLISWSTERVNCTTGLFFTFICFKSYWFITSNILQTSLLFFSLICRTCRSLLSGKEGKLNCL